MNYLIDTNVISEATRANPNPHVMEWLQTVDNGHLYISALTLGELRAGIEGLNPGVRQSKLYLWLEQDLPLFFDTRIIEITAKVADCWGRLRTQAKRPIPAIDSLIAAQAIHYDLCLVTRNIKDFNYPKLTLFNPWDKSGSQI